MRGTNAKQSSLLRRFFPKWKSFNGLSDAAVRRVEDCISNLPRIIFDYRSSEALFQAALFDVASSGQPKKHRYCINHAVWL